VQLEEFELIWQGEGDTDCEQNKAQNHIAKQTSQREGSCIKFQGSKTRLGGLYFTTRSIAGKMDELRAMINMWKCDIGAITETWLKEGHNW